MILSTLRLIFYMGSTEYYCISFITLLECHSSEEIKDCYPFEHCLIDIYELAGVRDKLDPTLQPSKTGTIKEVLQGLDQIYKNL